MVRSPTYSRLGYIPFDRRENNSGGIFFGGPQKLDGWRDPSLFLVFAPDDLLLLPREHMVQTPILDLPALQ